MKASGKNIMVSWFRRMSRSYPGVCGWTGGCGAGVAAAGMENVIPKRGAWQKDGGEKQRVRK